MPQTKDLLRLRRHLEIMMQSKVQISCALRRMLCCQYSQRSPGYESKSGYVLAGPGVQIVERGRKIHEEKKRPPPSFSRCTTYSLPTYHRTLLSGRLE